MATITVGEDAPPIARILAVALRRAAAQPKLARRLAWMRGKVAIRSTVDPQAATIHFARGDVRVTGGADPAADVVISADVNTMGRPGAPNPKVKGAVRHLLLALGTAKVLDPPVAGGWRGAANEFWTWAEGRRGRPDQLKVVCTDTDNDGGPELVLGTPGGTSCELHGPAWALTAVLTGGDHLGAALFEGRLQTVGSLPVISEFVGLVTARMLGE